MNLLLIAWNLSSWAEFSLRTNLAVVVFSPSLQPRLFHCANSHHTDWPVICKSPMVMLIAHDCPATDPQHSIWIREAASRAYQWKPDWMCMARGQRGVSAQWSLLIQSIAGLEIPVWHEGGSSISTMYSSAWGKMLCRAALLTFTASPGAAQTCRCV